MQVLMVCVVTIVVIAAGWGFYWWLVRNGESDFTKSCKIVLVCLSYGTCSWGMSVVNKALVVALDAPTLVTGAQMVMTTIGTLVLARSQLGGPRKEIMRWSFVPFIFFGILVSSFFAYKYLTLSMLMIIRNVSPLITLPIEYAVMPAEKCPNVNKMMIVALLLGMVATLVYCEQLTISLLGCFFALLNLVLAITDRVVQRRLLTTDCQNLTTEMAMFLNNSIGMIPTVIMALALGEFAKVNLKVWFCSVTTIILLLSGVIGTGICYFALAAQREITATSFFVLQNAVRMAVVLVGVVVFLDPIGFPWQVTGLALSFMAALWYGKAQIDANRQARELKEAEALKTDKLGSDASGAAILKSGG